MMSRFNDTSHYDVIIWKYNVIKYICIFFPFFFQKGPCRFDPAHVGATCKGVGQISPGNETTLEEIVATFGPVAIVVDASHASFQLYKSGVYNEPSCSPEQLDHAMVVVGYGTTGGEDYWIVQNRYGYKTALCRKASLPFSCWIIWKDLNSYLYFRSFVDFRTRSGYLGHR